MLKQIVFLARRVWITELVQLRFSAHRGTKTWRQSLLTSDPCLISPQRQTSVSLISEPKAADTTSGMEEYNVIKSTNDKKNYRVIKLRNGLTALLISDPPPDGSPMLSEEEYESNEESEHSESLEESGPESEEDMEEDCDAGTQASGAAVKQSAAALCVRIGSFSDPNEVPGFAHFLEHMVFMGSEKYPKENELDDYLNRNGGESNAWTDHERCLFYFNIQQKKFRKALDRFANFFISPLLLKDTVDREIQAVDSEFQLSLQCDDDRLNEILRTTAKSDHPMRRFMMGNLKSLKLDPERQGIDVYERLRDFFVRNYSAHYMTLAIQSMDNLDVMEKWVRDIFSDVPNNNLPVPRASDDVEPFNTPEFAKLYRVIPFEDSHRLQIVWALPSLVAKYREKPLEYFTTLLQHEGKGSILSHLKKKLWAVAISGGGSASCGSFDNNSTWTCFYVDITLSDEGMKHPMEVATVVFEYLHMLRQLEPEQRIFEETQKIEEAKFRWKEPGDPMDYVEEVAEAMQNYPPEHYLTGKTQLYDYNPKLLWECLDAMLPHKASIMLLSKWFEKAGTCSLTEPWFGTHYSVQDIDDSWKEKWNNLECNPNLFIPEPNPFIVTNMDLKEREGDSQAEVPRLVTDCERCKIWFKKDNKFNVPKGIIYLRLKSSLISKSLENVVLCDLLINLLLQTLAESAYPAVLAGYDYCVEGLEDSILLQMDGFSEKLPMLLMMVVDHIVNFTVKPDQFEMVKEQLEKAYYNMIIKPDELASSLHLAILKPAHRCQSERYAVVQNTTPAQMSLFHQELLADLNAEGLVFGNFSAQEAEGIASSLQTKMGISMTPSSVSHPRLRQIPEGMHTCRVKSVKGDDPNSCVVNYYQAGPGTIHTSCVNQLLNVIMREPCFDCLRTKHQLSYTVFSQAVENYGILGLTINVEPQAHKFSMDQVESMMSEFLVNFEEYILKMSEEEFTSMVGSMVTQRKTADTHMGEEASRLWNEIQKSCYVFNRRQREIEELVKINKEELVAWYRQFQGPGCRKLSLQVEGCSNPSKSALEMERQQDGNPEKSLCSVFHLELCQPTRVDSGFITDIPKFCTKLQLLPCSRVVS